MRVVRARSPSVAVMLFALSLWAICLMVLYANPGGSGDVMAALAVVSP